jgi:hypothetical protein
VHREIDHEFVRVRIEPSGRIIAPFLAVRACEDLDVIVGRGAGEPGKRIPD